MTTTNVGEVLVQVAAERQRQIALGWTPQHDAQFNVDKLVRHALTQAKRTGPDAEEGYYSRERLIQAAALLVAAVELMDRSKS